MSKTIPMKPTPVEIADTPATEFAPLQSYPDAVALANLVAQPRFASLSDAEAVQSALTLLHKCQAAINQDSRSMQGAQRAFEEYEELTGGPKSFPATLDDFYCFVVRGRAASQHRFYLFLERQFEALIELDSGLATSKHELVNQKLKAYQDNGFTKDDWYITAMGYIHWWSERQHANKVRGGLIRVQKHRAEKKARKAS